MSTWEAVRGSHLGWAQCTGCGEPVLTTEAFADRGRCGTCAAPQVAGDVGVPGPVSAHTAPDPDLVRAYRALEVPRSEHPKPLVPVREARELEIPSAARTVRKLAESHAWKVHATYALGWMLGAKGDTRALTHTVALRVQLGGTMMPDTRMIVAVWNVKEPSEDLLKVADRGVCDVPVPSTGWKFDLAYGWGGGAPHHKLSAAALKESIKEAS